MELVSYGRDEIYRENLWGYTLEVVCLVDRKVNWRDDNIKMDLIEIVYNYSK
jgi:hypothetical protein